MKLMGMDGWNGRLRFWVPSQIRSGGLIADRWPDNEVGAIGWEKDPVGDNHVCALKTDPYQNPTRETSQNEPARVYRDPLRSLAPYPASQASGRIRCFGQRERRLNSS